MVSLLGGVLALALAASPPLTAETATAAVGAVRLLAGRPTLQARAGAAALPARSGARLAVGVEVDTGAGGWAELLVLEVGRARLSADTRVALFDDGALRLSAGRVWVQHADGTRPALVELPEGEVRIEPGTSALLERRARAGTTLAVRVGGARLIGPGGEQVHVRPGELARLAPGAAAPEAARPGGRALFDLADAEARRVLGDFAGVHRFLLERVASTQPARPRPRRELLRTSPELSGGGPAAYTLEAAVPPAPFFEAEVPPKGPNVRLEVSFGD